MYAHVCVYMHVCVCVPVYYERQEGELWAEGFCCLGF